MDKKQHKDLGVVLEEAFKKLPEYLYKKAKYREAMGIRSSVQRRKILRNKSS